jgi:glycine/sarcosine N-methyltransferase
MMGFYESIADYYDRIFPLDEAQVDFVTTAIPPPLRGKTALDVGCGTGSLAVALSSYGLRVTGIDLDAAMIERAVAKSKTELNVNFQQLDLREIATRFAPSTFNVVLCLGNTLVHLKERSDIFLVFINIKEMLAQGGRFLLQILNYDYILDSQPPGLPTVERGDVKFERSYSYNNDGSITFRTTLKVNVTGLTITNDAPLYPLRKADLETMLKESGFRDLRFYGDFHRGPLTARSLPLVVEAG